MNSAITITLALTTICCFANGVVAVGDVIQDLSELKEELNNYFIIFWTANQAWSEASELRRYEEVRTVVSRFSSINSSILSYAANAGKNGAEAFQSCQSKFENDAKNLMYLSNGHNPKVCHNEGYSKIDAAYAMIYQLFWQVESLLSRTEDVVKSYKEEKEYADKHILGRDDKNTTLTERAKECVDDSMNRMNERINYAVKKAKDCIDKTDGAVQGLSREPST